jgi:general secretion pathway protein D
MRPFAVRLVAGIVAFCVSPGLFAQEPPKNENGGTGANGEQPAAGEKRVNINFGGVSLEAVLEAVAAKTKKRFLYEESIKGKKIYLISRVDVPESSFFEVMLSILEMQGYAVIPVGGTDSQVYKVVQASIAPKKPLPTYAKGEELPQDERIITQVIPLKFADPQSVQTLVSTLVGQGGMIPIPEINAIVVTDNALNLRRISKIVELIDVEKPGLKTKVFMLKYANAMELQQKLSSFAQVITTQARQVRAGGMITQQQEPLVILADQRTNSLFVIAYEERIKQLGDLVTELDIEIPNPPKGMHVYLLKHAKAKDLAEKLNAIYSGPGSPLKNQGTSAGGTTIATSSSIVTSGSAGQPGIVADEQNNALIISADQKVYDEMKEVIEALDTRRPQVLLEAAIVEVTGTDNMDFGFELATVDKAGENARGFGGTLFGLSTLMDTDGDDVPDIKLPLPNQGMTWGLFKDKAGKIPLLVQMMKTRTNVKVISVPQVTTNDNVKAELKVEEQEPTTTQSTISGSQTTYSFGGYQPAGITLTITPHICDENSLRLEIEQKLERFRGTSPAPGVPRPKTSRSVSTTVTVPNGRTVVVGGLVSDTFDDTARGVPILSDIPLFGKLFERNITDKLKTTLYIFIIPHIIYERGFEDLLGLTNRKLKDVPDDIRQRLADLSEVEEEMKPRALDTYRYESPFDFDWRPENEEAGREE